EPVRRAHRAAFRWPRAHRPRNARHRRRKGCAPGERPTHLGEERRYRKDDAEQGFGDASRIIKRPHGRTNCRPRSLPSLSAQRCAHRKAATGENAEEVSGASESMAATWRARCALIALSWTLNPTERLIF